MKVGKFRSIFGHALKLGQDGYLYFDRMPVAVLMLPKAKPAVAGMLFAETHNVGAPHARVYQKRERETRLRPDWI